MRINLMNNRAKFHPDPIWNDEDLGFFKMLPDKKKKKNNNKKKSNDTRSVPAPKTRNDALESCTMRSEA